MDWVGKLWIGNVSGDTWTDPFVCVCVHTGLLSLVPSGLPFTSHDCFRQEADK